MYKCGSNNSLQRFQPMELKNREIFIQGIPHPLQSFENSVFQNDNFCIWEQFWVQFEGFSHQIFTSSGSGDENGCQSPFGEFIKATGRGQTIVIAPSRKTHFRRKLRSFSFNILTHLPYLSLKSNFGISGCKSWVYFFLAYCKII